MTAVDDGPQAHAQMQPEQFEALAAAATREADGLRLEFIGGKLGVKAVPDGLHETITMWLVRQCLQHAPALDLHTGQGLRIETYRKGRARPDGVLAPTAHFVRAGEWADPEGVLMTVEVSTHEYEAHDHGTNQRDRVEKPRAFAESGVPVYLLIDREADEVTVYSEPVDGSYQERHSAAFGKTVTLPEPVGITLGTEPLKTWSATARGSDA
ncbi:Uma2 family endonuclease [Streptomyces sp. NPDC057654]|uniref:Uma2 family endonuclease n=1 Tax=Streptomyces sp. NPDC057654 TaxID=3346196 RepID=UPI003678BA6F